MAEGRLSQPLRDGARPLAIFGATGFAGALAAHLFWRHPGFELRALAGRSEVGASHDRLYPRYRVPMAIADPRQVEVGELELAIVAYPHAAAAPMVADLLERGLRVIDLSADFRLRAADSYAAHYGEHPHEELLGSAVYGLPELHRGELVRARLVAGPGCFPTAALLALAPLARADLIEDVVIDAKTGVSGAGRAATDVTHFSNVDENVKPYKVANHRHTPEIEEQLALLGFDRPVQFQAHLLPFDQGELLSCYVTPSRPLGEQELQALYAAAYSRERFVELAEQPPGVREVRDTNFCRIFARSDERTGRLLIFAALDNLWKGTSAQALQSANLMFGYPESEGLL